MVENGWYSPGGRLMTERNDSLRPKGLAWQQADTPSRLALVRRVAIATKIGVERLPRLMDKVLAEAWKRLAVQAVSAVGQVAGLPSRCIAAELDERE